MIIDNVHGMLTLVISLGRVKENVYVNHIASETSARSGMSSALIVVMVTGRSDEISLKSISL